MSRRLIGVLDWMEFKPKIKALVDQVENAIFIVDNVGIILTLNKSACKLTGYELQELIGKPVTVFFPNHKHFFDSALDQTIPNDKTKRVPPIENFIKKIDEIYTKNGRKIPIHITHIHLPVLKGNINCIVVRNISDKVISETLREINFHLSSSLNLVQIFDILLVELRKLIPYDGGNVTLVAGRSIHVTRTLGYETIGEKHSDLLNSLHFDIESTENIRQIVTNRQPLIIGDTHKTHYWIRNEVYELFRSWIGVPIVIDNEVDAIISLDKAEPDFFTEEHASILTIFANQAASAIKNARLYEAETLRIQQLDGLQSTLAAINSQLDLQTLVKEIVIKAITLLHASSGELILYDPEKNQLSILVSLNTRHDMTGKYYEVNSGVIGRVASTKKPMVLDQTTDDMEIKQGMDFQGAYSGVAVPLLAGTQLMGVLALADRKPGRTFNENDVIFLDTFAQQATIAIKNSQLFEASKRRAEEAETLRKTGAVITSNLDQAQAINLILEQLALVVPYDMAAVQLQKKDYLYVIGQRGFSKPDFLMSHKMLLTDRIPEAVVYNEKKALLVGDISNEFPMINTERGPDEEIKSWLGAPLIIQDRAIGVIFLNSYQQNWFNQDQVHMLTAFADQVAVALENARLYTDTARSADKFKTLYHLSQIISTNLRSEDIYPAIHQAVSELMVTDFFCITLFNSENRILQDAYIMDKRKHLHLRTRPLNKGLTSTVIKNGKSLLFHTFDAAAAQETGSEGLSKLEEARMPQSILMVPLTIGANRIGVMSAQCYQPNMYTSSDRDILELLAANVAIAIENARLFDEVQQLAITDPLTKLYNRRKFTEVSIKEFDRSHRYHRPLCMIMIDLDHFKEVNDSFGHLAGDQVLLGLASLCKNNLRNIDVLARVGGEEFMVLLPETTCTEALATAERLRQECEIMDFITNQGVVKLTISLGLVELDDSCQNLEEFVDRADQALYASKHAGRNTCTLWTPDLDQAASAGMHNIH